ncbi:MAG: GGDEF domain-containing protein [Chloroflexota bacterium]|nr:GGDEF domain-containing protein [Chloroflexota bacterium]
MTWPFTPVSMIFATLLAASGLAAAIALENARLYAEVQQLAVVNELTGLYNRRGLVQFGEREFTRSARFARPLSALMIDLDHFKTVNDTYGHAAGDRVLRQVADCLRSKARSVDILARYGGEELLLLLPEADLAQATQVAERLRLVIERTSVLVDGEQVRVTASAGVAALTSDTPDLASLIARADSAVYQAKQAGRNRVSSEDGSPQDHPIACAANPPSGGTGTEAAR